MLVFFVLRITWSHLVSLLDLTFSHMVSHRLTKTHKDSQGLTRNHKDSQGLTRTHQDSQGLTRTHKDSLGLTWSGEQRRKVAHGRVTATPTTWSRLVWRTAAKSGARTSDRDPDHLVSLGLANNGEKWRTDERPRPRLGRDLNDFACYVQVLRDLNNVVCYVLGFSYI